MTKEKVVSILKEQLLLERLKVGVRNVQLTRVKARGIESARGELRRCVNCGEPRWKHLYWSNRCDYVPVRKNEP
jgi:hypothetical protein